jgi:hypothetical protein
MASAKWSVKRDLGRKSGDLMGEVRWVRKLLIEWYRLTHSSENLNPSWVVKHLIPQLPLICRILSEREKQSGQVATP